MADAAKPTNMLSTKGQAIPPAATRRRHNWRPGTRLAVEDTADGVLFIGAHDIFLGRFGFFELYEPNGYDPAKLLEGLCREFRGDRLGFKPYACGCPQHAILDAAIGARDQLGLGTAVDLAGLRTCRCRLRRDCCRAIQWRRAQAPAYADCRGSVRTAYLIATALVHGRVGITEVAEIDNAQVLTIAAQMEGIGAEQETDGIMIRLLDGRTATVRIGSPLGSPENRLSIGQLEMKFVDCARNAVRPLPDDAVRAAADNILHLEDVQDVGELLRPFV